MERWIAGGVACIVAVAWVAAVAWAGSQVDPEVKDPAGDGMDQGRDIIAAWIDYVPPDEDGKDALAFSVETATSPTASYPALHGFQNRWTLWFKPTMGLPAGKNAAYVAFRYGFGTTASTNSPVLNTYLGFTATAGTFDNVNTEITSGITGTIQGKVFRGVVPLSNLKDFKAASDSLTQIYANVVLASKGPATGLQGQDINVIHQTYDRAPNAGFGRDFAPAPPAPAGVVEFLVEAPPNATVAVNGTAVVPLLVTNNGTLPFNATVNVTGNEAFSATLESADAAVPVNGSAMFNITLTGLGTGNGTLDGVVEAGGVNQTFQIAVTVVAPATAAGTNETAPSPAEAGESSRGIPATPFVLVAAATAILALQLRRRRT